MPSAPEALPVLYSFRRCPYAMRARMALLACGQAVAVREVVLRDKPDALLALSDKATVPVLQLPHGEVLVESVDIMQWAVAKAGAHERLKSGHADTTRLIVENDREFKYWLDRYKYFDRYPQHSQQYYRDQACEFLAQLERRLSTSPQLLGTRESLADYAIMPFVRQFAAVDRDWFGQAGYASLQQWHAHWMQHQVYLQAMEKYPQWQPGGCEPVLNFTARL